MRQARILWSTLCYTVYDIQSGNQCYHSELIFIEILSRCQYSLNAASLQRRRMRIFKISNNKFDTNLTMNFLSSANSHFPVYECILVPNGHDRPKRSPADPKWRRCTFQSGENKMSLSTVYPGDRPSPHSRYYYCKNHTLYRGLIGLFQNPALFNLLQFIQKAKCRREGCRSLNPFGITNTPIIGKPADGRRWIMQVLFMQFVKTIVV